MVIYKNYKEFVAVNFVCEGLKFWELSGGILKRKFRGVCVQQNWVQGVTVIQLNEKVSVVTKTDYTNLSSSSSN